MFAIFGLDQTPINASFKTDPETFEERCQEYRFYPAPYLARDTWVGTSDLEHLSWNEWKTFLDEAYQLKFNRLPKKLQLQLLEAGNR
jgi:predicted DNA-binding protein (MmcQ/YjbR family)